MVAAPFWSDIEENSDSAQRETQKYLRTLFPSLLITGPFSIVLGFNGGLMALNDRLKLRSMVIGEKDDKVFIASEEAGHSGPWSRMLKTYGRPPAASR